MAKYFTPEFITYAEAHSRAKLVKTKDKSTLAKLNMNTAGLYAEAALIKGFNANGFRYKHLNSAQQNAAYGFNKDDVQVGAAARKAADAIDTMAINKIDQIKQKIEDTGRELLGTNTKINFGQAQAIRANSNIGDIDLGSIALEVKLKSADVDLVNWSNITEAKFFGTDKPFSRYVTLQHPDEYWNYTKPKQQWMQELGKALHNFIQDNYNDREFFNYLRFKGLSKNYLGNKFNGKIIIGLQATNLSNKRPTDMKVHIESDIDMWNRLFVASQTKTSSGTSISYKQNQSEYGTQWFDKENNLVVSFVISRFLKSKQYMQQKNAAEDQNNFNILISDKDYLDFTFSTYINSKYFFNDSYL